MYANSSSSSNSALPSHTTSVSAATPISLFQSGQLLALKPDCHGGLILHKGFYADFVGPGAAVGGSFDIKCTSVYVAGVVEFNVPETFAERQEAFKNRLNYIKLLEQIALEPSSPRRAQLILQQLCEWLGETEAHKIPRELVAKLAGLHPVQKQWRSSSNSENGL